MILHNVVGDLSTRGTDFYEKFDVVIVSRCSLNAKVCSKFFLDIIYQLSSLASMQGSPCHAVYVFNIFRLDFLMSQKTINQKCRKLSKRIAFYSVDCRDSCGEIFADLQNHSCTQVCMTLIC